MNERQRYYLYTHYINGLGPRTVISGLETGRSIEEIVSVFSPHKEVLESIDVLEKLAFQHGYRFVSWEDDDYIPSLRTIPDPPLWYFAKGKCTLDRPIAVVGTRAITSYGRSVTQDLSRLIVSNGCTIVSGFMRGVDTVAHLETVKQKKPTIAILGSGFVHPVPPENRALIDQIIDTGGMILSEFLPDQKATKFTFPRRNRIVSGISELVIVVEAGAKSGALITARLAAEQGKRVLVVPGSLYSTKSAGCHWLIQNGAEVITSIEGVIEQIGFTDTVAKDELVFESDEEAEVFEYISAGPIYINDLVSVVGKKVYVLLPLLTNMELRGLIKNIGNDTYVVQ